MAVYDHDTFWLSMDHGYSWEKVSIASFMAAERACGFHGSDRSRPATHSFSSGIFRGLTRYAGTDCTDLEEDDAH